MAETREALLKAGAALFAAKGLDGPSLDAICERAGYTRGAFYVHFRDRDDFLVAVMEREGAPLLDAVLGAPGGEPVGLDEAVGRFVGAVASGAYPLTRKGGPRPHQLLDACLRSKKLRARYLGLLAETVSRLAASVARSQEGATVRRDVDPEALATTLLAAVIGAHTMMELGAPVDLPGAAGALLALLAPAGEGAQPRRRAPRRRSEATRTRAKAATPRRSPDER